MEIPTLACIEFLFSDEWTTDNDNSDSHKDDSLQSICGVQESSAKECALKAVSAQGDLCGVKVKGLIGCAAQVGGHAGCGLRGSGFIACGAKAMGVNECGLYGAGKGLNANQAGAYFCMVRGSAASNGLEKLEMGACGQEGRISSEYILKVGGYLCGSKLNGNSTCALDIGTELCGSKSSGASICGFNIRVGVCSVDSEDFSTDFGIGLSVD